MAAVFELAIAVAIVVALILAALIPALALLWLGVGAGSIGALVGLLAGLVYHTKLWRALQREGVEPTGIWLRPYLLHDKLSEDRRAPVQTWFIVGATGFGLTMLGATAVFTAIVRLAAT